MATFSGWEQAVLSDLGITPTPGDVAFLDTWQRYEQSGAKFNPLNTTLVEPGATNYNSFGPGGRYHVENYPSASVGAMATASTLKQSQYTAIVAALQSGDPGKYLKDPTNLQTITGQLRTWGSGTFADDLNKLQGALNAGPGSGLSPGKGSVAAGILDAINPLEFAKRVWAWIQAHLLRLGLLIGGGLLIILGLFLIARNAGAVPNVVPV